MYYCILYIINYVIVNINTISGNALNEFFFTAYFEYVLF